MKLKNVVCLLVSLALLQTSALAERADRNIPQLSEWEAEWVGQRIFNNECGRRVDCLTSWNIGEDFPSLGIGHFIWYRQGQQDPFVESFPQLLSFYDSQAVAYPDWIRRLPERAAPWQTREQFQADLEEPHLRELRTFLHDTMSVQAQFIVNRLYDSVPKLQAATDRPEEVSELFYQLANTQQPHGMYALIDYVNFKGEGTAPAERYQGQGWGLLQVLERMLDHPSEAPLLRRFADASKWVLARRVENAPPERNEARWTQGWNNRAETYVP